MPVKPSGCSPVSIISSNFLELCYTENMKLVIIFGPHAVGKMTVGHELEKSTGLKLFHNHMTIDMVARFFSYGTPQGKRLVNLFRTEIFKEVAASDLPGLIFTYVWWFDDKGDWDYIQNVASIFREKGAKIYWVELEANIGERLIRNKSEHRLNHKPTKRDVESSEQQLRDNMVNHRLNSLPGEITQENYLRIDNTNLSPSVVAEQIKMAFHL